MSTERRTLCRKIWVSGRVQGVSFRASARDHAKKLGLIGYAQNLTDGRVELLAEGLEDSLDRFIEWCKKGPLLAKVTEIVVEEISETGFQFDDFIIRH